MDLTTTLAEASRIARQAGIIIQTYAKQPIKEFTKSSDTDIVTEADKASEAFIVREILRLYPDHHLVGEEGGGQGAAINDAAYHWYIDPIDGTTNYANRIPHYCISIAMTDAERNPLVGVIYDPNLDELFSAVHGQGATCNDQPISVSNTTDLVECVIASGFPALKPNATSASFTGRVRGMRRFGSAALDFAYVAAGRLEGYWERNLKPWDAMAGMLIVREAGGTVTDYSGGHQPQWDETGRYVASNTHIHAQMLEAIVVSR